MSEPEKPRLSPEETARLMKIVERASAQIHRMLNLARYAHTTEMDESIRDEIFRASIVFAHATLEDTVRELVRRRWREWPDAMLDKLSFRDCKDRSKERITVTELGRHMDRRIDEVIEEAVNRFLDETSISSARKLCELLIPLGIDPEKCMLDVAARHPYFNYLSMKTLQQIIDRRHRIVHNNDYYSPTAERQSLSVDEVIEWLACVLNCVIAIIAEEAKLAGASELAQASIQLMFTAAIDDATPG